MSSVKFYTLGCKVNQYDTQAMREALLRVGFKETFNGSQADICVINTCTVTARADSESLGLVRRARRENPAARIVVTGCLAELDLARIRGTDKKSLILKNKDKEDILEKLSLEDRHATKGISDFKGHTRAFLKIQDGCDNFCAYCKVPLVRGRSTSKPLSQIIIEANRLIKNGFQEIVLTGICLGAYGRDLRPEIGLTEVIGELEKIKPLSRIRLSSIEARDVSDALIKKIAGSKKLCRHLHIPIQSGDDKILKDMHRRYTRKDYLALFARLRRKIPSIAITTDVLVGFPGETEENFKNTLDLIKRVMPLKVHIFPYSKRNGTTAAQDTDKEVSTSIIKDRLCALKKLSETCADSYKKKFAHKKMLVLFEEEMKDRPGWWQGYTDNYILVQVKSNRNLRNKLISVTLGAGTVP